MLLRAAAAARRWNGATPAARPAASPHEWRVTHPDLLLYEYEASPWCRRVRETLCLLDLEHSVFPCPRETLRLEGAYGARSRHRPAVAAAGGALRFPFLHDRTQHAALNGSEAIVAHLWRHYGQDAARTRLDAVLNGGALPRALDFAALAAPSVLRPWAECGLMLAPSRRAEAPLVLHGCEPQPGSRLLREKLCILQLPYVYKPRGVEVGAIPHLADPNTGWASFGARDGLNYLEETYQLGPPLKLNAPVPDPNFGDKHSTSWLSIFFRP
ncbi:hypothetical protein AB1Y20_011241 [Prymnesium parvum]|uniref:GST N-terminal domain-containing protein n=1 Tax=Prymnesium parvum TaxID=97485 RepID=A0AB34IPZ4_PRYPA